MKIRSFALVFWATVILTTALAALSWSATTALATTASPPVTALHLDQTTGYTPKAPPGGGTDDYHCTVMNPHVTRDSYIVSSQFFPGSQEDHHAIIFLVPPDLAATAEADNANNQGWTCFGESQFPTLG